MSKRNSSLAVACCLAIGSALTQSSVLGQERIEGLRDRVEQIEARLDDHLAIEEQSQDDAQSLRVLVQQAFDAKQALHRAQLQLMEKRVELLRTDIERREVLSDQIVEQRVKELLSGEERLSSQQRKETSSAPVSENHGQPTIAGKPDKKLSVFYLNQVKAEAAYNLLNDLVADWGDIRLARDDRLNSLLVEANTDRTLQIQQLIKIIDASPEEVEKDTLAVETMTTDGQAILKQYKVQGNRDMLIQGLLHLFRNSESTRIGPTGEHRIVVLADEKDQIKAQSWLEASDSEVPYLVAIPTENDRLQRLASLEELESILKQKQAELSQNFGPKHPSLKPVLAQLDLLAEERSQLKKDRVIFNVYLAPWRKSTISDAIAAVPKKAQVKCGIHPRGHLEISGPRKAVVEFGDTLVEFLNDSSEMRWLLTLQERKTLAESEFKTLSEKYAADHPDVQAIAEQIRQLNTEIRALNKKD